ncbi:MAG TPA: hypothetical protein VK427_27035 [Kofleriaceae bacterium]|nr:hypothetical protein [Kofleriaceae bacterium]
MEKPQHKTTECNEPLDWAPVQGAAMDVLDWALDIARRLARRDVQAISAVERVRHFLLRRMLGYPAHVRLADVTLTLRLIMDAIQRDLSRVDALGLPFERMQFPSASELWERAVPRHFNPAQWLGSLLRSATN